MVISKVSSAYMFKPTDMLNICSVQVFFLWHCSMQAFPLMIKGLLLLLLLFADACWCAIVLVMSYNLWLMWQRCWYRMLLLQLRIMIIELDVECILSLLFLRSTRYIYCEISVHGCHENLLFTNVFAVLQVKLRLQTYYQNIDSLLSTYEDVIVKVGTISFNWKLSVPSVLSKLMWTKKKILLTSVI